MWGVGGIDLKEIRVGMLQNSHTRKGSLGSEVRVILNETVGFALVYLESSGGWGEI